MTRDELPELPLEAWSEGKTTLHLYAQIVGKIRMALHPRLNHWWHVPLYVSSRGLTTRPIPTGARLVEIEFDLVDHELVMWNDQGRREAFELRDGLTVAAFYEGVLAGLRRLGVEVRIVAKPFDPARVGSTIPFSRDREHGRYDPTMVHRFWTILRWSHAVFTEFQGDFYGKSTPVHFFWHSLDLAYTRFSGRRAPQVPGADAVTREAYSHEVISFGFWAGDDLVRAPAYYAYSAPEPVGLARESLAPHEAFWRDSDGSAMALLMYDDLRRLADPRGALLDFLQSAYLAGATRAGWNTETTEAITPVPDPPAGARRGHE